jgi:hypothetical protein
MLRYAVYCHPPPLTWLVVILYLLFAFISANGCQLCEGMSPFPFPSCPSLVLFKRGTLGSYTNLVLCHAMLKLKLQRKRKLTPTENGSSPRSATQASTTCSLRTRTNRLKPSARSPTLPDRERSRYSFRGGRWGRLCQRGGRVRSVCNGGRCLQSELRG